MKKVFSFVINGIKCNIHCYSEERFEEQKKLFQKHIIDCINEKYFKEIDFYLVENPKVYDNAKYKIALAPPLKLSPNRGLDLLKYTNDNSEQFLSLKNDFIAIHSKDKFIILNNMNNYDKYISVSIVLEVVSKIMEEHNNFLFHSTGFTLDGKGIMCLAASGGGKTTLFSKLASGGSCNQINFLSNDRIFLSEDMTMKYFPIDILYSMGTVKHDDYLRRYFITHNICENNLGSTIDTVADNKKIGIGPKAIEKIYKMISKSKLDFIIAPKINFKDRNIIRISEMDLRDKISLLQNCCFTPTDMESARFPWILTRAKQDTYYQHNANKIFENIIQQIPFLYIEYGCDCNNAMLVESLGNYFNKLQTEGDNHIE